MQVCASGDLQGHLGTIVELSKRLNAVLHRKDQLQAYCDAVRSISASLTGVHVGFCRDERPVPDEIYMVHGPEQTSVNRVAWDAISNDGQVILSQALHSDEVRRGREKGARTFQTLPQVSREGLPSYTETEDIPMERFFFITQTAVQGIVVLQGRGGARDPLFGQDRDALRLCTELLSVAIENGDLFEKILHAKQEWERTVDAIRDVVMIIGADYIIRRANRHVADLAAVPIEKMHGNRCHSLLHQREAPCPCCPGHETLRSERESTAEVLSQDGRRIFQVSCYPIFNVTGRLDSIAVYEKDVTEFKEMQKQLLHSEKMAVMGRLAAAVAHELNNPLSGVISFSQILLKQIDPASPMYEDVKVLEHAALRCKNIVEDLLAFSRKPEVHKTEEVEVREVVQRSMSLMDHRLRQKNIEVSVEIEEGLPTVHTNPDQLQQVLVNLICNAEDAMEPGGRLWIRASHDEGEGSMLLFVQDTGGGIPSEGLKKIFEPFYTTKRAGKGTGLGLSISSRIVEALGGSIEVSSTVGSGSTFIVRLPITRKASFSEGI